MAVGRGVVARFSLFGVVLGRGYLQIFDPAVEDSFNNVLAYSRVQKLRSTK